MGRLRDYLTRPSRVRYLWWRGIRSRSALEVRHRAGLQLILRPKPATDLDTAYEVFVEECYRPPMDPGPVRTIVDLGANVGYSCLYWQIQFPGAHTTAFEPHPGHVEQIHRHLATNGVANRVEVVAAAAATRSGTVRLTDDENRSEVGAAGTLEVPAEDLFARLVGRRIDLLKIDIEGHEYDLLADARFPTLDVGALVLEWHRRGDRDGVWCADRLTACGYRVTAVRSGADVGLQWAWRRNA